LYTKDSPNHDTSLVKVVARILGLELAEVSVNSFSDYQHKTVIGQFPILETLDGANLFGSISIVRYLARQQKGFYGNNDYESKSI